MNGPSGHHPRVRDHQVTTINSPLIAISIMSHTILLIQPTKPETRAYSDYDSINEAMEGELMSLSQRNPDW